MKIKAAVAVFVLIGIAFYAAFSAKVEFAPAEDLPREAVIYVEFTDLQAFIQLWEKSELKQKYLESENFNSLRQRRLGLKLASRWQEFNEAVGFPLDLEIIGGLAEKRSAIGIYDIGKLEFVFIAPVSDEFFAATNFFQNKTQFEEKLLDNGTSIFSADVAADRGRQPQKLLFANLKGRFILATSEKLLLQTINNINGKTNKNSLTDEPAFNSLTENSNPNLVSVWTNQTALNKDFYFKRYWLMSDTNKLENIRAGIFDVSLENNKIVERRKFLLNTEVKSTRLNIVETQKMLSIVPPDTAFYRLRTADAKISVSAIFDCIFDRKISIAKAEPRDYFPSYSFYDFDDSEQSDYEYLNRKFDEAIDEIPEENYGNSKVVDDKSFESNLQNILQIANPQTILTLTEPKNLPAPLFAEFRRAAVIRTIAPVPQMHLETAVAQAARRRVSLAAANINLSWTTVEENGLVWRKLNLPMLGWEICYAQLGGHLIVSNSSNLLKKILVQPENTEKAKIFESPIDHFTMIDLKNKNENFDQIFGKLAAENSPDFFAGSIGSLLESVSGIETIEIESSFNSKYRNEKLTFNFEADF